MARTLGQSGACDARYTLGESSGAVLKFSYISRDSSSNRSSRSIAMSTSIEFDYKLYWYSHQLHDKMVWETIFQIYSNTVPVFILRIISCTLSIEFDSEQPVSVLTSYRRHKVSTAN